MVAAVLGPFGAAAGITGVVRGAGVAGEYGTHPGYFLAMCAAAVDCLQVDVSRAGGHTGWLRAAAIAAAHELEVSGHCVPQQGAFAQAAIPNFRHLE